MDKLTPQQIALLLQTALTFIPFLVKEYQSLSAKGAYSAEERKDLDADIEKHKTEPWWQE